MGIIDYLRAYTVDKKLESAVKTLQTSLSQSHPEQPTIINPIEYAGRFMRAMGTYFVADRNHEIDEDGRDGELWPS